MPTYKFNGLIGADHKVELPTEIPVGWAEIVVMTDRSAGQRPALDSVLHDLARRPPRNRSKEEIDAELQAERGSWE